jgi:hypothetical protein
MKSKLLPNRANHFGHFSCPVLIVFKLAILKHLIGVTKPLLQSRNLSHKLGDCWYFRQDCHKLLVCFCFRLFFAFNFIIFALFCINLALNLLFQDLFQFLCSDQLFFKQTAYELLCLANQFKVV